MPVAARISGSSSNRTGISRPAHWAANDRNPVASAAPSAARNVPPRTASHSMPSRATNANTSSGAAYDSATNSGPNWRSIASGSGLRPGLT